MLVRSLASSLPRARRGAVLPWFIVTGPIMLALFTLAVQSASLRHRQLELQIAADAAATAAADDLLDERLFTDLPDRQDQVVRSVRDTALRYGELNRVWGKPLHIEPNYENYTDRELVLGRLDAAKGPTFDADIQPPPELYTAGLNAVHIRVRRVGAAAAATAFVDQDVIGFKIQGSHTLKGQSRPAIPVAPLAILTDPCPPGLNQKDSWLQKAPLSWEYQILARQGSDGWGLDPATGQPRAQGDHIPEMKVVFTARGGDQKDNGRIAGIGVQSLDQAIRQLTTGITADDLKDRGNQLLLNDGLGLDPRDNRAVVPQLSLSASDIQSLATGLRALIGQRRIWMLYDGQAANSQQTVLIRGFVAARVMDVQVQTSTGSDGKGPPRLSVILQPCTLVTATAVTDRSRRDLGPRTLFNPYIGRVRLVE